MKRFQGIVALDDVAVSIEIGEVHALLGENGAGKSTLGKIASGVYLPDAGTIWLDGEQVSIENEATASALGIGIVHQEGSLTPQLSISENIFAGRQPVRFAGWIDWETMNHKASSLLADLGFKIDPRTKVEHLTSAQCQIVEIAKAISQRLRLLILDEPTAALTSAETSRLFEIVRALTAKGVSIIYVSHRLSEIFEIADRVTVLKDGRVTGTRTITETSREDLIRLMVGRDVAAITKGTLEPGGILLDCRNVADGNKVRDASLVVRNGEIVCLTGLIGSGRSELCEIVFGARGSIAGMIIFDGTAHCPRNPKAAIAAGVGMVPEDRKDAGLFLDMSIASNIAAASLDKLSTFGLLSQSRIVELARKFIRQLRIATPNSDKIVGELSGGNQQKALIAKWLAIKPRLLIVDEPTRGVDVGAREEIYRLLGALASEGVGLLVVSSELPEVLALADRIVVMADGVTVGEIVGSSATEEAIMTLSANATSGRLAA